MPQFELSIKYAQRTKVIFATEFGNNSSEIITKIADF